jgi:hypothetical protein
MKMLWGPVIGEAVGVTYRRGCGTEKVKIDMTYQVVFGRY